MHLAPPRTQGSAAACVRPAPILHDHGRVRISDLRSVRGERGCPVRAPVHGWLVLVMSTWGGTDYGGSWTLPFLLTSCACAAPLAVRARTGSQSLIMDPVHRLWAVCGLCRRARVLPKCENSVSPRDLSLCGIGGHYWTVPIGDELKTLMYCS